MEKIIQNFIIMRNNIIRKMVSNIMRLIGDLLGIAALFAKYFIAANGIDGIVGALAALSYAIADGIDLYGMISS